MIRIKSNTTITITNTLIINVLDYDCDYILSYHVYNHEFNVYHTNVNVILY